MVRIALAGALVLAPALAFAQGEAELIEDLRVGMQSKNTDLLENAAIRVWRVSKTIDRPERLLPLVEQAIFSRHGSFEWGTVGQGHSALMQIAARATTPGPVMDTIEKIRTQYPRSQTRWELVWEANTLVKRFPVEVLPRLVPMLSDPSSGVREIGLDAIASGVRQMPLVQGMLALETLLPQVPERHRKFLLEDARSLLYRAQQIPMTELPALRASLDELVSRLKSAELQAAVREVRSELTTRAMEREGKSDRFANYRRVDGSLQWGELFRAKLGMKPKGGGENYSNPRRGAPGEVVKGFLPEVVASEVFKTVHQAAQAQAKDALAKATTPAERAQLQARVKALEGLTVRYVETNDILARRSGKVIEVSYGLLHEVYARSMRLMEAGKVSAGERGMYQARVLGLVFGHEVAHASGMKAERAADALGVRTVWSSLLKPQNQAQAEVALKSTIELFEQPTGARAFDNLLYRIKNFFRYGTPRGRLEALRRAANGQPDPLQRFRRGDGTVQWQKVAAERAAREAAGVAKFGLALFLKELAIVAQTGDKARIEEFFDYVLSTDFYKHYGLFVAGARLGEVAYGRYLSRYVKPRFVNGVLKTNLALAAGMALPMIVEGNFEGKAFAISFASLGISSALVQGGVRTIRWVTTLSKARNAGLLARFGPAAGRLARVGGWFYTVGELAVVLYLAETIETEVNERLAEREARRAVADANVDLAQTLADPNASEEAIQEALDRNHEAWIGYRDYLFRPLLIEEAKMAARVGKAAREAKLQSDEQAAILARAAKMPSLRNNLERRYGSLEGYAERRASEQAADLQRRMDELLAGYGERREALFREVYQAERREEAYLGDADLSALDAGAGRSDVFGRWNRDRARSALASDLRDLSRNRLQTYEDEQALLKQLSERHAGNEALAAALVAHQARVQRLHEADTRLSRGEPIVEAGPAQQGAVQKLPGR